MDKTNGGMAFMINATQDALRLCDWVQSGNTRHEQPGNPSLTNGCCCCVWSWWAFHSGTMKVRGLFAVGQPPQPRSL